MGTEQIFNEIVGLLNQYWVILALMAVESSFIPFPSEVVMIPAAYLAIASTGDFGPIDPTMPTSNLNIVLIVVAGTIGAMLGAWVNYGLSIWLGRPIIYKFANSRIGHICQLDQQKVEKAEHYFDEHGAVGTLFGRLVPVVRQLISIPAGLARMNFAKFSLFTTLGALIWNTILATIGYLIATQVPYQFLYKKITEYSSELKWIMYGLGIAVVLYLIYSARKKK